MLSALERPDATEILSAHRFAHVAVAARGGPQVTLAAYVVSSGHLWFAASRKTVKVKAIRRNPTISVLVGGGERSLVISGRAQVISGWGTEDVANLLGNAVDTGRAAAAFAMRHAGLLARSARDFVEAGRLPTDRVLVRLKPTRGIISTGGQVTGSWGRWRRTSLSPQPGRAPAKALVLDGIPRNAARALVDARSCAVGWECPWGPLVIPGRLHADGTEVWVPSALMRVAGVAARSKMCVTLDRGADRAGNVVGVILRGEGTVLRQTDGILRIGLDSDRVSWWSGFKTGTVRRTAVAANTPAR